MVAAQKSDEIITISVGDRQVQFRPPTDAQILVLGRMMKVAEGVEDDEKDRVKLTGSIQKLSRVLDIIDSMVIDSADRDWLEEEIIAGRLNMGQLTEVFHPDNFEVAGNRATRRTAKKTTSRARKS